MCHEPSTLPAGAAGCKSPVLSFFLAGSVTITTPIPHSIVTVSTATTYVSCKTTPVQLTAGQVNQILVSASGALTCQVTTTPGTFSANVLAVAEVTVDSVSLTLQKCVTGGQGCVTNL